MGPEAALPAGHVAAPWDLLSSGTFEEDSTLVAGAMALDRPPRSVCSVSAGVHEFARAVPDPDGVFGIAQWVPGAVTGAQLGPTAEQFQIAYARLTGTVPDYPAVQAAAAAVVASHCAAVAGDLAPEALWPVAAALKTSTLFGPFGIDPETGAQLRHETLLVRWTGGRLTLAERGE
jgi:hypothetical protein